MSRYRGLASQWNKSPFTKPIHPVRASPHPMLARLLIASKNAKASSQLSDILFGERFTAVRG